ncbi:MAG: zinc-ribbon domain-containing protein [Polyangiaceae bacterium]
MANARPDLAAQWHPTRNGGLRPTQITAGTTRKVWWRCSAVPKHEWQGSPAVRSRLTGGCPFCLGLRTCSRNALAATNPGVAAEWHPTKNKGLTPHDVVEGSGRRVWWQCGRHPDHEWQALVYNRTLRRSGCPFCAGRKASGTHSLATAYPAIAREWHPVRNGDVTPASVTPRARRTAWWLCPKGHEWPAPVATRTRRGTVCPACSGARQPPAPHAPAARGTLNAPAPIARMSVIQRLREEHGRIEQILLLLTSDPEYRGVSRFAGELTAHLEAETLVLYPVVERALNRHLSGQRELQSRLRRMLSGLGAPDHDRRLRSERLRELHTTFHEVSRFEEQVAFPVLEELMPPRALEELVRTMILAARSRSRPTAKQRTDAPLAEAFVKE